VRQALVFPLAASVLAAAWAPDFLAQTRTAPPAPAAARAEAADVLLGFVEIPAGPFLMGTDPMRDPQGFENERWSRDVAQGRVDLPAFYIAAYEVTVGDFRAFVEATGFKADPQALRGLASHPVGYVSWTDALAYCRWLQAKLLTSPQTPARLKELLGSGWRVSLPSEAEWEKAARGADGRIYPWGDTPRRDRANFGGNAGTTPVGQFECPECAYPLFDMSGNVWEWTRSPNQPYPYNPSDDRANLTTDALWIMRGGHFGDPARFARAATRGAAEPGARRAFIGFRVALSRF
jgi:formylglycine-generating enzyme required for sulfatase activity